MSLAKFMTVFDEPTKANGYPLELGIIIDITMLGVQLFVTWEFLGRDLQPIGIVSEPIPEADYNGLIRIPVPDVDTYPDCCYLRAYASDEEVNQPLADFYLVDEMGRFITDDNGDLIIIN